MKIERCPDVCARAWWQPDEKFGGGQYNCPYRFGVTHAAATVDGRVLCDHFKRKGDGKWTAS